MFQNNETGSDEQGYSCVGEKVIKNHLLEEEPFGLRLEG